MNGSQTLQKTSTRRELESTDVPARARTRRRRSLILPGVVNAVPVLCISMLVLERLLYARTLTMAITSLLALAVMCAAGARLGGVRGLLPLLPLFLLPLARIGAQLFLGSGLEDVKSALMMWSISATAMLAGWAFFEGCGLPGYERFALRVTGLVIAGCLFGLLLQYVLSFGFATDTFHLRRAIVSDPRPFETYRLADPLTERMTSIFSHPILFAHFLLFALIVTMTLARRRRWRDAVAVLLGTCLLLTQTRGAWLLLPLLAIVYLASRRGLSLRVRLRTAFAALVVLAVTALMLSRLGVFDFMADRFGRLGVDASFTQRMGGIAYLLRGMAGSTTRMLIGSGAGAASRAIGSTIIVIGGGWSAVDNGVVSLAYDYGVPYTLLLLATVCVVAVPSLRRSAPDAAFVAALAGVVLGVANMAFYDVMTWASTNWLLFFSLGFLAHARKDHAVR